MVTFADQTLTLAGQFPTVGSPAPAFTLTASDLSSKTLADFAGKRKILNIVPSLDTPVCAKSTHEFFKKASLSPNTVVIAISADLPFAAKRFCTTENLAVETLSTYKNPEFKKAYGVDILDSKLAGLTARAVLVLDENNKVVYAQLVQDISQEPNYEAALQALGVPA